MRAADHHAVRALAARREMDREMTREQFDAAIEQHRPYLVRYAKSRVNHHEAEDIVNDAVTQILARKSYARKRRGNLLAWLTSAVAMVALDRHKANGVRARYAEEAAQDPDIHVDPQERVVLRVAVSRAMAALPEDLREIVFALYFDGYTQEEIADSLGVTQQAVSKKVQAAFDIMRGKLVDFVSDGGLLDKQTDGGSNKEADRDGIFTTELYGTPV